MEALLHTIEKIKLRWFRHLASMSPGLLQRRTGADPGHVGGIIPLSWLENALVSSKRGCWKLSGRGVSGFPCQDPGAGDPDPEDEWMESESAGHRR